MFVQLSGSGLFEKIEREMSKYAKNGVNGLQSVTYFSTHVFAFKFSHRPHTGVTGAIFFLNWSRM